MDDAAGNCDGMTAFALRLAKRLADNGDDVNNNRNLVFSLVSLYAALALVAAGGQGTTLHELLALLGASSLDDLAESVYRAVEPKKSRKKINEWVSKATNKLIPEILPDGSVHRLTTLVLVNAIYFKGKWSDPFPRESTTTGKFHRLDGSSVNVRFMRSREDQYIGFYDGFNVLKLPYNGGL
uniref:Serpin (Serine protease inhibitor) n=3 Tax=Oryza TaxID=4527 RepID=Q2R885_ORYSJ|nr:Similar to serpin homolog WZS3 - wheat [Oryza sativa Japonica Group]AAX95888.1 Serpin (serine protease inhibitor) [Oryza sativa Japonica Group]ABA92265.1 Serpin family protein [Oryza sativa Japonica Group]